MEGQDGYRAVMRLAQERPELLAAVRASLARADAAQPYGGDFAGAWVLRELGSWLPGLRTLRAAGILEKSGPSTRSGNRAYYRMPDREGVRQALAELGQFRGAPSPT